jgi:alkylhydroperoxidase family enzyme
MNTLDIALAYIRRNWNPVPAPHGAKTPIDSGWQKRVITEENVADHFNGQAQNIGVILGPTSDGLTDVDLDCHEATELASHFLPQTGAIFGRSSKPRSHHLYRTSLAETSGKAVLRYQDPITGSTLVELRVGGENGAQTIFPGSVHKSGEPIEWDETGGPAEIDGKELRERVTLLAAAALLARHWPSKGSRHDAALALGRILSRAGYDEADIGDFVEVVARTARGGFQPCIDALPSWLMRIVREVGPGTSLQTLR